jgi:hypothetical protein
MLGFLLAVATLSVACNRPSRLTASAGGASSAAAGPEADSGGGHGEAAAPDFANRVWKVAKGSEGDPGTFYVFLSDGSMLVTSPHGTPALGAWHYSGEVLTLVEEGIPHQATILRTTPDTFSIRIAGPGRPVLLTFIPAATK